MSLAILQVKGLGPCISKKDVSSLYNQSNIYCSNGCCKFQKKRKETLDRIGHTGNPVTQEIGNILEVQKVEEILYKKESKSES